jgi:hypothetical protein
MLPTEDLAGGSDDDDIVSAPEVEAAIRQLAGVVAQRDLAFVISAFDTPRIVYDPVSKRLHPDSRPSKLLPTSEVRLWPGSRGCVAAHGAVATGRQGPKLQRQCS